MLGTPDAYLLPSLPGLGYLKVDTSHYVQFRAALVLRPVRPGAGRRRRERAAAGARVRRRRARARRAGGEPRAGRRAERAERAAGARRPPRRAAATPVHQVWVAPLPEAEPLDAVLDAARRGGAAASAREGLRGRVGRLDRPAEQRTEPFELDLAGAGGHVAVVGAPRTGKSTLLRTLAASLISRHTPDAGCSSTASTSAAACSARSTARRTSAASPASSTARRSTRVVRQLRRPRSRIARGCSASAGWESDARRPRRRRAACRTSSCSIDGWEAFKREFEGLDRELEELAATGLSFGVHLVVAANRWAEIRPALLDNLGTRLELRLNDAIDSLVSRAGRRRAARRRPRPRPDDGRPALPDRAAAGRRARRATRAPATRSATHRRARSAAHWSGPRAEPIRLLPRALDAGATCRRRRRARACRSASRSAACDPVLGRPARRRPALPRVRRRRDAASRRCCAALARGLVAAARARASCSSSSSTCAAR